MTRAAERCSRACREPYRFDFFQTLRRLECLHPTSRAGRRAAPGRRAGPPRPGSGAVFAPAPLASFELGRRRRRRGCSAAAVRPARPERPAAAAPHRVRARAAAPRRRSDARRFLDMLHHRFLALFYRAWAQAQPHVNLRPAGRRSLRRLRRRVRSASAPRRCATATRCRTSPKLFFAGALVAAGAQRRRPGGDPAALLPRAGARSSSSSATGCALERAASARACGATAARRSARGAVLGGSVWDRAAQVPHRPRPADAGRSTRASCPAARALRAAGATGCGCISASSSTGTCACSRSATRCRALQLGPARARLGWTTLARRTRRVDATTADDLCLRCGSVRRPMP